MFFCYKDYPLDNLVDQRPHQFLPPEIFSCFTTGKTEVSMRSFFFVKFNFVVLLKNRRLYVFWEEWRQVAGLKLWLFYPLPSPQLVWSWWQDRNCFLTNKQNSNLLTNWQTNKQTKNEQAPEKLTCSQTNKQESKKESKQASKQASNQANTWEASRFSNKQTNKQTNKNKQTQTNKQTNKHRIS